MSRQQFTALGQPDVGGNPVAFGQDDKVAPHHLAAGDTLSQAVAHDEGARACHVAERGENAFASNFLHQRDRYGEGANSASATASVNWPKMK